MSGPRATRAAPVSVARSTRRSGVSSAASASASASTSRPFGVGVADLDGEALAALEDIAGAEGSAGDGVLDGRDQDPEADFQTGVHDHAGEAEGIGGAAHVLLHQQHPGGRLDVEAAGIEADALADDGDLAIAGIAPGEINEARSAVRRRGGADRVDQREVGGQQCVANYLGEADSVSGGQIASGLGEIGRAHVVGWRVDEIAGEGDAVGDAGDVRAINAGGKDQAARAEPVGAIAREAIGAESEGETGQRRIGEAIAQAINARRKNGGEFAGKKRRGRLALAEAEENRGDAPLASVQRRDDGDFAGTGGEAGGADPGGSAAVEGSEQRREALGCDRVDRN